MPEPHKTVPEVLAELRKNRSPAIEIALQDFMELQHHEQMEFLLTGLLTLTRQVDWLIAKSK